MVGGPFRKIGREKNRGPWSSQIQSGGEKLREISLHAEGLARTAATECGRVENDGIESLAPLGESAKVGGDILGDESVVGGRNGVEFEIPARALEGGFGNIHA